MFKFYNNVKLGVARNFYKTMGTFLLSMAGLWGILEGPLTLLKFNLEAFISIPIFILLSIIITIIRIYPLNSITIDLNYINTTVEILFADLFEIDSYRVIAVTKFFDTKIGKPVASGTVHGYFIEKVLKNDISRLESEIAEELKTAKFNIIKRTDGKDKEYEIGTTISHNYNGLKYFLFALCFTDEDCKAKCTPSIALEALSKLWAKVRKESNGYDVSIPLVGLGQGSIGLNPNQVIDLILISILNASTSGRITAKINIVIHPNMFKNINLKQIKEYRR